ncbi:MAG: MCP four helix bundle domain-containing protein [Bacillota bacterium]
MKWFSNMKVGAKLISAFVLAAIIASIIGIVGFTSLNEVGSIRLPGVANLLGIDKEFARIGSYENELMNSKLSYEEKLNTYKEIGEAKAQLQGYWDEYLKLPKGEEEKALWARLKQPLPNGKRA